MYLFWASVANCTMFCYGVVHLPCALKMQVHSDPVTSVLSFVIYCDCRPVSSDFGGTPSQHAIIHIWGESRIWGWGSHRWVWMRTKILTVQVGEFNRNAEL